MELQTVRKKTLTSLEGTGGHRNNKKELRVQQMNSTWELIPWLRLKRNAYFPQAPQEEDSLSYRYVSGTWSLLPHGERTLRCTDLKECRITLQWLEYRLVFLLIRNMDVSIPCGEPRESHSSLSHYKRRLHIPLTSGESLRLQWNKMRWNILPLKNW